MSPINEQRSRIDISPDRTLGALLEAGARKFHNKPYLIYEDKSYSFQEVNHLADKIATQFNHIGINRGDKVAIFLPNCPEFIFVWFALMKIGAIEVPINIEHKGELLSYLLTNSVAKAVVTTKDFLTELSAVKDQINVEHVILLEDTSEMDTMDSFHLHSLQHMLERESTWHSIPISPSEPFSYMYTSGTTGNSKGVVLPHNYAVYMGDVIKSIFQYESEDVIYVCLPLFHGNAQMLALVPALISGATVVLDKKFSSSKFWDTIRKYSVTITNVVGSVIAILQKAPATTLDRDHSLRAVFTAATPSHILEAFEKRFGTTIYEGYGSTECGMVLMNTKEIRKNGSIGKPVDGYEVAIVNELDEKVGPNIIGEIVTRPKFPNTMMKEYFNMPEATLETTRNLWFHTGDLGYQDSQGFFYFSDRKKDAIRKHGENISSMELERLISMHPKVKECAAIGVPSELAEEEILIAVVKQDELSETELINYCKQKMAKYMVPRYIRWVEDLPKTPTQRVQKYKLKAEGINAHTWDGESEFKK
jgi:crotonobetaine/carnitine-CoA ligase